MSGDTLKTTACIGRSVLHDGKFFFIATTEDPLHKHPITSHLLLCRDDLVALKRDISYHLTATSDSDETLDIDIERWEALSHRDADTESPIVHRYCGQWWYWNELRNSRSGPYFTESDAHEQWTTHREWEEEENRAAQILDEQWMTNGCP